MHCKLREIQVFLAEGGEKKKKHECVQFAAVCCSMQDRVKRIENCVNVQAKVPTDPTVKNFGMQIKGQMMEVTTLSWHLLRASIFGSQDKVTLQCICCTNCP